ncbi:MAG TPA: M81 family metallopeptidase [Steroidobacteraceae bacterium]|nr:M81 family metallopeptidase [Steroidobacteraceae bacterium]
MARIAVGGFQHETNTFSPRLATLVDFETPDAWPGLTRGPALFEAIAGINLPAAGFVAEARSLRHTLLPLTWCSAQPSGRVTQQAFEHIADLLCADLRAAGSLDAVYLDLHGAMVAEHVDDADGEVLRRVRAVVGPDVPVVASLDYHANVSACMTQQATVLVAYQTYPHVDMAECGGRAARCLHDLLGKPRPAIAFEPLDFLVPLTSQSTLAQPMRDIAAMAAQLERRPLLAVNVAPGFPAADVPECGPSAYACGWDPAAARDAVSRLVAALREREAEFALELYSVTEACRLAQSAMAPRGRPLVLADTQDNPGAGGNADTTTLLKALVAARLREVLAGVYCDPQAAARAHEAGVGARIDLELGGRSGPPGETPLAARFDVVALGDGRFVGTGPFYRGGRFDLGPMALLRIDDVHVVVASRKQQAADQAMFRHLGADPGDFAVLALKSSVHFRADFGAIASRIVVVEAPGPNVADPAKLPFTRLRPGMRTRPRRG